MVCALSFLREHDGANNGNDGGEGRGAFCMRAMWLPVHVGRASGRVFTRLSCVVQQDGDDNDGCMLHYEKLWYLFYRYLCVSHGTT